jgi:hypothetical protein
MAEQRSTIEFTVDRLSIAALTAGPVDGTVAGPGKPLIAALHGGGLPRAAAVQDDQRAVAG